MNSFLFVILPILCGTLCLYWYFKRIYTFWSKRNVVGPKPSFLLGNIGDFAIGKKFVGELMADIYHMYPEEKVVGVYLVNKPALIVRDLDLAQHILVKDFRYFSERGVRYSEEGFGTNLFHSDVTTWNILRKSHSQLFSSAKLKNTMHLVNECCQIFMNFIDVELSKYETFDAHDLCSRYTIRVICSTGFGLESNTITEDDCNVFLDFGNKIFTPSLSGLLETIAPGSLQMLNLSFFRSDIRKFFLELIRKKSSEREGKVKVRGDFMDNFIEMKEQGSIRGTDKLGQEVVLRMSEHTVAAQALLVFAAGYETTATTMSYALHELALNPHVQAKLIEEVDRVWDECGGELSYEALVRLEYMDMVLSETMRKHPIVEIQRSAVSDYKVPGEDLVIPEGTIVFVPAFGIQMDPKHWPEPDKFVPERFSRAEKALRHPMSFLTFGEGPRICIGERFAKMVLKISLVHFFKHFTVRATDLTASKVSFTEFRLVFHPKGGLHVAIDKRE